MDESNPENGREALHILSKDVLVRKTADIKILPFVARKLLDTIGDENASITDLSDLIEKDQAIAARVLKISNSALYGVRQEVTSLQRAVALLGFKTIRSIVLTASTRSLYNNFGMKEQIIWDHSVCASIAAKFISSDIGSELEDITFLGGLMHDIGKIIMNNETPDVFAEVMMKTYNESVDSLATENEVYGYDHIDIGVEVMRKWGFSPVLIEIIEHHHLNNESLQNMKDPLLAKSIACVNMADNVCKVLGVGYRSPDETIVLHTLPSAIFLGIKKEKIHLLLAKIQETFNEEKSVFQ